MAKGANPGDMFETEPPWPDPGGGRATLSSAERLIRGAARRAGREVGTHRLPEPDGPAGRQVATHLVEAVHGRLELPGAPPLPVSFRLLLPAVTHLADHVRSGARRGRRALSAEIGPELGRHGLREAASAREALDLALSALSASLPADAASLAPALARRLDPLPCGPLPPESVADALPALLAEAVSGAMRERRDERLAAAAMRDAGYGRYVSLFPKARALGRRLVLLVGPTNSGKTHEALRMAAAGADAVVLSPLRLLALEHYEALDAMGLPSGMLTGEERLHLDGATHVAQTVETMDPSREVDVAVVDEAQMLGDPARGWAWTRAVVGVPARTVVMTGSPDAIPLVEAVAAMTGEPLEVRRLERKAPLMALQRAVALSEVERGDAVVAFSRRAAMALRDGLRACGHEVAMVYGSLSPEVRRSEARRFADGEADVIVATDAIGMGLNLPVRRVLFSELAKFDGRGMRPLTDPEIRQIGGRAGRYGLSEGGECGVLSGLDPRRVARALAATPVVPSDPRPFVRPSREAVLCAASDLGTTSLVRVLVRLRDTLVEGAPTLRMADLREEVEAAAAVDGMDLPVGTKLDLATAPIPPRDPAALHALRSWGAALAEGRPCECPDPCYRDQAGAEAAVRVWGAYVWLSWRHPAAFPDVALARAHMADANADIERWLRASPWRRAARMGMAVA